MSKPINAGGPAFPRSSQGPAGDCDNAEGMSLRDWFAGMALQGILANPVISPARSLTRGAEMQERVSAALDYADTLLIQLNRP